MGAHIKGWFVLTARERWVLGVILGLFLLGLVARYWHATRHTQSPLDGNGDTVAAGVVVEK